MERSELRLACLKLAHSKIQPREDAAATTTKAETYFEFVTLQPVIAEVTAPRASQGNRKKKKK